MLVDKLAAENHESRPWESSFRGVGNLPTSAIRSTHGSVASCNESPEFFASFCRQYISNLAVSGLQMEAGAVNGASGLFEYWEDLSRLLDSSFLNFTDPSPVSRA